MKCYFHHRYAENVLTRLLTDSLTNQATYRTRYIFVDIKSTSENISILNIQDSLDARSILDNFDFINIISQNKDVFIKLKWSLSMISSNDPSHCVPVVDRCTDCCASLLCPGSLQHFCLGKLRLIFT